MAKFKLIFSLVFIGVSFFMLNSCQQDNPTITLPDKHTGPTTNGHIEVFVRQGTPTGPYIGGAKVQIFLSAEDRTNDNVHQSNDTPMEDITEKGAMFKNLPYQKYFIRASYSNAQGIWMGADEVYAVKGTTTKIHVTCVQ
jgi:hypothetical protein